MSTLTYVHNKDFASQVNNSFITTQGGLIEKKYSVAPAFTVKKGSIASFCGGDDLQVCEGLGPIWSRPFIPKESWSPAVLVSVAQLSLYTSLYCHVADSDHTSIRVTFISTSGSAPPYTNTTATFTPIGGQPIVSLHARATNTPNVVILMYSTPTDTILQAVTATPDGTININQNHLFLFNWHNATNATLHRDITVADSLVLISYAYDDAGPQFLAYKVDTSTMTWLTPVSVTGSTGIFITASIANEYLGNGYFLQVTGSSLALAKIDFTANTIGAVQTHDVPVILRFIQVHVFHNNLLLVAGTQTDFVMDPLPLTYFVEWYNAAPFLRVHTPTNLLGDQFHTMQNYFISMCSLPPSDQEPIGGLFFTYLDARSNRAKIARGKAVWSGNDLHLLPSPSLDISSHRYNRFQNIFTAPPHLTCPIGTGSNHVLITMQDLTSIFNTFTWAGGYRFAGVAQADVSSGKELDVVRAGISSSHDRLIAGYTYYLYNNGSLAPFTSTHETFTSNGFPLPIGTAISPQQLHLEPEAFDRWF